MKNKGFTLVELLIVVAIIGIVSAIAIPNLLIAMQKGKQKATMGDMRSIGAAIESYITDYSHAPQATYLDLTTADYFIPFYNQIPPTYDSWGTVYAFVSTFDQYSLQSAGRDKVFAVPNPLIYETTNISDFDNDIIYCNGVFIASPKVKK